MRTYSEQRGVGQQRRGLFSPCLVFCLSPCLLALLLLGLKLWGDPSPEKMLQEGHRALERRDYQSAVTFFQQAEQRSTNPAEVAFYLAESKYRLAAKGEGLSLELLEAEQLYRCCLDPSDPHRPYALCGLGNCLLHKAGPSDEGSLRSALACYDLCLNCSGKDKGLAAAARYNREKARLLLLQFLPLPDSTGDRPPSDDFLPHQPRPHDYRQAWQLPPGAEGGDAGTDPSSVPGEAKQDQGNDAAKNNDPTQPGKGNLPPIPDEIDVPPLAAQLAGEHLERAAKKVLQERQSHHRRDEDASAKGVMDW